MSEDGDYKEFKNFEIKTSYVVIAVILAVVIRFWGESSITMLQKDVPVVSTTEISATEIGRYVQTRQEFLAEKINIENPSDNIEENMDDEIHEWFLLRGWRPNRYFYVENRIKLILALQAERENKLHEASLLDAQAEQAKAMEYVTKSFEPKKNKKNKKRFEENNEAANIKKRANEIRYDIDREFRAAEINMNEDNMVAANKDILASLLEQ